MVAFPERVKNVDEKVALLRWNFKVHKNTVFRNSKVPFFVVIILGWEVNCDSTDLPKKFRVAFVIGLVRRTELSELGYYAREQERASFWRGNHAIEVSLSFKCGTYDLRF